MRFYRAALGCVFLSLFCLHAAAVSAQPRAYGARDLFGRQAVLPGKGVDEPYPLPDSLLISGSETVYLNDSLLTREAGYTLDYVRGLLRFSTVLTVSDTAVVRYQVFPFHLRTSYFHPLRTMTPDQIAAADTSTAPPPAPGSGDTPLFDTGSLRKSGTLIRGITVGSDRDLSVQSGMNLQVEGRLGRNMDVLALLSDQNTPLQPEGNTATLQEIDKVLIQVQNPRFTATLGDYELNLGGGRFGGYYRKLQGARLEGRLSDERGVVSGAVSKGEYHTNFIPGQESNQGPYRLSSKEGRTGILVLAGTERVWVDGQLMTRGENNDYTIEYGLGEITFTPRRLITSDSRITVDFQYSDEAYGRDIYAAQAEGRFGASGGVRATLISESDARNSPLTFALTDSARSALEAAGDDPATAQVEAVDSVETGQGTYVRETASWGGQSHSIFVYVGPDSSGYLIVAFSYVGAGEGDYNREASATDFYYTWVGPGEGDYSPVQRLALPERQRLANVEAWVNPTRSTMLKVEGAVSERDRNTFSPLGDGDNVGIAWAAEGQWNGLRAAPGDSASYDRLGLTANVRQVDDRFTRIDRIHQVEYDRQWGLEGAQSEQETVREATLSTRPLRAWSGRTTYGLLDKEQDGIHSERWSHESVFSGARLPTVTAAADWIRSATEASGRQGVWTRGRSTAGYRWKRWTPSLFYEREHKRDDYADSTGGFLFQAYGTGLEYQAGPLKLGTTQELRHDQTYRQNVLKEHSDAWTSTWQADLAAWRNLSGDVLYTHRVKGFTEADSGDLATDLAEINLGWTPWRRLADVMAHYRVNSTRVSTIVQTPVFVGAGQGTHVKVGDLFFPDPDGEYILVAQSTGQFQPVVELDGSLALDLDPHRLPREEQEKIAGPWKHLASETLLNFSEKTREREVWSLYLLDFSRFQGDSTQYGNLLLREDLFLFRHRRDLSFRLRGEISQSLSNLYLSGGQETRRRLVSLRVRRAFDARWSAQAEAGQETEERVYRAGSASDRDIQTWKASLEPTFKPRREWELALRLVGQQDDDRVENLRALRYGAEPRVVRSFTEKGRVEVRGEWHHVATSAPELPYEMAEGDPPGDNFRWDLRLDYRLSKYLTAGVSYNGSKDAGRNAIHIGRAEVKAFF
ncbi:MAG: hypothetical protein C4524_13765 [Candidatus Zixiibacteriota bacterium]|nr:MAG: hypothetical protein C4524_13765 [candidate division Zixibacteria bacterium]